MHFMAMMKSRKRSAWFHSNLEYNAFTTVKLDSKFLTKYVKGVQFVHRRYSKGVPLLYKMVYLSNRPHFVWVSRRDNPRGMLEEHSKSL